MESNQTTGWNFPRGGSPIELDIGSPRPSHGPRSSSQSVQALFCSEDEDDDTDSSVTLASSSHNGRSPTLENDPDRQCYLNDDVVETAAPDFGEVEQIIARQKRRRLDSYQRNRSLDIVDLTIDTEAQITEGDYLTDACFARLLRNWNREEDLAQPSSPQPVKQEIAEACLDGIIYKPGQSVELHDDSFLRILKVLEDASGSVFLRGRRLFKIKNLLAEEKPKNYLPRWRDELLWVTNENLDIALGFVKQFAPVRFTNRIESDHDRRAGSQSKASGLFCRLKEFSDSEQVSVQHLSKCEADHGYKVQPWELRHHWRGSTPSFGTAKKKTPRARNSVIDLDPPLPGPAVIDLTRPESSNGMNRRSPESRTYNFGDAFCGAGGVSSGARKAGLRIKWAFDNSSNAVATYRLNFDTATCEHSDIFDFLSNDPTFTRVDICHGSPPCQTFSPAHTIECATDDANFACIFSCADLIRSAKPRVLTMEETAGLYQRHRDIFCRVIQSFLEIGYSVGWKLLNCKDYGVPQRRQRLIIIASGPGEALPNFPRPTHGFPGSGLLECTTMETELSNIPAGTPDHDASAAFARGLRSGPKTPYDSGQQIHTMTTSGGEGNYHPSGKRGFTNREFACLQTFPLSHRFGKHEVRKQIGNAVPPVLAKSIYREIIKSLRRTDKAELSERVGETEVIEV